MAGTLGDMKTRIASEMSRPDLAAQIALAIPDAINTYQKDRFRFSDINPSTPLTFLTVAQQSVYSSVALADIATIYFIDYINVQIGSSLFRLTRDDPENLHTLIQIGTQAGLPSVFAYEGNSILLYPVPNTAYTCYLGGHIQIAGPPADDTVGNPWMTVGEKLIRSRAKFEIAVHVTRNLAMQKAMSPEPPPAGTPDGHMSWRYWRELKGEGAKATGQSRMRAMRF